MKFEIMILFNTDEVTSTSILDYEKIRFVKYNRGNVV
jgi:hypothetical protein